MSDDDPLADADRGERAEDSHEIELGLWDAAPSQWLGEDRKVTDLDAGNIRIEGESGNERIVFNVDVELQAVDRGTYPVFQTAERYEELQDWQAREPAPTPSDTVLPTWAARLLPVGIVAALGAVGVWLGNRMLAAADLRINGEALEPVGVAGMAVMVLVFLVFALALQYMPGGFAGGGHA